MAATVTVTDPICSDAGAARTHRVELISMAYDSGWRSMGAHRQTLTVTRNPGFDDPAKYELTSRLSLKPGRYELRFAADSGGLTGSVYVSLEVPNFAKEPLSLSGMLLEKATTRRAPVGASLTDLLPIVPTTTRTFTRVDQPVAFLRVYEGGSKPAMPVAMTASIKNSQDEIVSSRASTIEPGAFANARSADYRFTVPIGTLLPGEYLLTIGATSDGRSLDRAVRFTVE